MEIDDTWVGVMGVMLISPVGLACSTFLAVGASPRAALHCVCCAGRARRRVEPASSRSEWLSGTRMTDRLDRSWQPYFARVSGPWAGRPAHGIPLF